MSESEVRTALIGWRAGQEAMQQMGDESGKRLADGYVGALEMVLRGKDGIDPAMHARALSLLIQSADTITELERRLAELGHPVVHD